jgi:hypothetical protein
MQWIDAISSKTSRRDAAIRLTSARLRLPHKVDGFRVDRKPPPALYLVATASSEIIHATPNQDDYVLDRGTLLRFSRRGPERDATQRDRARQEHADRQGTARTEMDGRAALGQLQCATRQARNTAATGRLPGPADALGRARVSCVAIFAPWNYRSTAIAYGAEFSRGLLAVTDISSNKTAAVLRLSY